MSVCYVFMWAQQNRAPFPIHCEEPELASVSGSLLHPAAAWRSSMSLTETLLRLIQGEIMGPATPNPLKSSSSSTAQQQAGQAQGGEGCQRSRYKTHSHAYNLWCIPHMLFLCIVQEVH